MSVRVNVDNFVQAETARMFDGMLATSGEVNRWFHNRVPTPIDAQTVIRMNRDTLYSFAIVDISNGAEVSLPEAGGRYMSAMVVNESHYINRVFDEPGTYQITVDEFDTPYVLIALRTLANPEDPADLEAAHTLQDAVGLECRSARPYTHPDYEEESRQATFNALIELSKGMPDSRHSFGRKEDVDPVRHLIGTAYGWGGLPESAAYYVVEADPTPVGSYTMTLDDVPVDGFWSVTIYNRDGFLEPNPYSSYSLNNLTAVPEPDGSYILNLSPAGEGLTNHLYVMDGWNYALRLYKPHQSILDGTWKPPTPQPTG